MVPAVCRTGILPQSSAHGQKRHFFGFRSEMFQVKEFRIFRYFVLYFGPHEVDILFDEF